MYYLGVDIGGTGIKAGIIDSDGNILDKNQCKTDVDSGFEKVLKDIKNLVDNLLEKNNLTTEMINSIGFGVPSFISKDGRVTCVNLGWHNVDFISKLQNTFYDLKIYAENDATVAALAEYKFGIMKNHDVALMLTLGTGIGGGIIINGRPFTGSNNMASEVGHIVIGENYYDCNCNTNGCFETFCSATAIIKYATKLIEEGNKSNILNLAEGKKENITAKHVFDSYKENDSVAIDTINRFKKYLSKGIGSLINTLDPSIIAIGGGVSKADEIILDGLRELVRENVLYKNHEFGDIGIAALGNDAGIIGAAFLGESISR